MNRKLILLPGMTSSYRIFEKLTPQLAAYEMIEWSEPGPCQDDCRIRSHTCGQIWHRFDKRFTRSFVWCHSGTGNRLALRNSSVFCGIIHQFPCRNPTCPARLGTLASTVPTFGIKSHRQLGACMAKSHRLHSSSEKVLWSRGRMVSLGHRGSAAMATTNGKHKNHSHPWRSR